MCSSFTWNEGQHNMTAVLKCCEYVELKKKHYIHTAQESSHSTSEHKKTNRYSSLCISQGKEFSKYFTCQENQQHKRGKAPISENVIS